MEVEVFLPNEIVELVLKNLRGKDMYRCRRVCKQWMSVVDHLTAAEDWWEELLRTDHRDIYKEELWKSGLSCKSLYKSLCLWSKVATAEITCKEIVSRRHLHDFQVLPNRIIGVPSFKKEGDEDDLGFEGYDRVKYYNLDTGQYKTKIMQVIFGTYEENDNLIVLVDDDTFGPQYMTVISKADETVTSHQTKLSFTFLLLDQSVYYVDTLGDIVCLSLVTNNEGKFDWQLRRFITDFNSNMLSTFSCCGGQVHCLTDAGDIYRCEKDYFFFTSSIEGRGCNQILHQLRCYQFISHDPGSYMHIYEAKLPKKITRMKVRAIVAHGDVVFLSCVSGTLHIYYSPMSSGQLRLSAKPDRICNINELCGTTAGNITNLAVTEIEDGHVVVVTTIQKILALKISHNITENWEEKKDCRKLKRINLSQSNASTSQCTKRATRSSASTSEIAKRLNTNQRSTRQTRQTTRQNEKNPCRTRKK